jgi:hypothetical protein
MPGTYAVIAARIGGATSCRMGLWDAVMIKDNHVAVAGGVGPAVARAKAAGVERISARPIGSTRSSRRSWPAPRISCSTI